MISSCKYKGEAKDANKTEQESTEYDYIL
jgi:hypothetical protein